MTEPMTGHNSDGRLLSFVERIERLEEEKRALASDIKDVFTEAGSTGYDKKQLRRVIAIRRQDAEKRAQEDAILDTYLSALGMA